MSGHSHWATVKRGKEAEDKKRGKIFSKMTRMILIAAKQGGPDPETNPRLRMAVEKAKQANMPKDNIERAIKKASGNQGDEKLEEIKIEAFGPENVALIITAITDNKNRTISEIKKILSQYNGKMANEGSVAWQFERKGVIIIPSVPETEKESLEIKAIDSGAEDIRWEENILEVYTKPEELDTVKKSLEEKQIEIDSSSLDFVAKEEIEADKDSLNKLFEALDENDDTQDIYSNLKT